MRATIKKAINDGARALAGSSVDQPQNEAALLMMEVLKRDRTFLIAHPEATLANDQIEQFNSLVTRRGEGHPLQYITGHQEFFRLDFEVTPDVLIPRPETELLVEIGLEILKDQPAPRFADIATGSGCIAISLLNELPQTQGVAVDISSAALAVAKRNAERHSAISRLQLIESDLFAALDPSTRFEAIFSNPPYIPSDELNSLQCEVRYEPQSALDGGPDGLVIIRRLLHEAPAFLRESGYLIFEIGFGQDQLIRQVIDPSVWEFVEIRKDLQGIPRTVVLKRK